MASQPNNDLSFNNLDSNQDAESWDRFRELLDDQNDWPTRYTFKFIVPASNVEAVKDVFGGHPVRIRSSSKGTYKSVTAHMKVASSQAVIETYKEASSIEGVIAL